jgi:hypothetical protein
MPDELKVGSKIWKFDVNCRVYQRDARGMAHGGPIYREHWREVEITGETRVSWLTHYGKAPKKGPHHGWAFTLREVEDDCWVKDHRYRIADTVQRCHDAEVLRRVAEVVGYVSGGEAA